MSTVTHIIQHQVYAMRKLQIDACNALNISHFPPPPRILICHSGWAVSTAEPIDPQSNERLCHCGRSEAKTRNPMLLSVIAGFLAERSRSITRNPMFIRGRIIVRSRVKRGMTECFLNRLSINN